MPSTKRDTRTSRVNSLGAALYYNCAVPNHDLSSHQTVSPDTSPQNPGAHATQLSYDSRALMNCNPDSFSVGFSEPPQATMADALKPAVASPSPKRRKKQSLSDKSWEATFERLLEYKRVNGDMLVPWRYQADPQLGNWVKEQRKKKKNGSLAPDREERLEAAGFVWRVQQNHRVEAWEDVFQRLVQYKEKHGNCMVPSNYKDDPKLGRWVSMQRFRQESLSQDRREKLESIGFV